MHHWVCPQCADASFTTLRQTHTCRFAGEIVFPSWPVEARCKATKIVDATTWSDAESNGLTTQSWLIACMFVLRVNEFKSRNPVQPCLRGSPRWLAGLPMPSALATGSGKPDSQGLELLKACRTLVQ